MAKNEETFEARAKRVLAELVELMRESADTSVKGAAKDDGPNAPKDEPKAGGRGRRGAAKEEAAEKAEKPAAKGGPIIAPKPDKDPEEMKSGEFRKYVIARINFIVEAFDARPEAEYEAFLDKHVQPILDEAKVKAVSDLDIEGIEDLNDELDKFEKSEKSEAEKAKNADEGGERPRRRRSADEGDERPRRRRD